MRRGWSKRLAQRRQGFPRIGIARVPKHPAVGAKLVGRLNLRSYFRRSERAMIESVVAKRLQPRPKAIGRKTGPLASSLEAEKDNFVRMIQRHGRRGNSVAERGRIEHRAYVIDRRRNVFELLADVGVVRVPARIAA